MSWRTFLRSMPFVILSALATPVAADGPALQGWGLRVGLAGGPDQVIGGVLLDFGEVAERLVLRPDFQLGVGDDHTILSATAPLHYRFRTPEVAFVPYAGGGVTLAYVDRDTPRVDDSDVEVALELIGGLEWVRDGGNAFSVELDLVIGDVHDFQVLAGWTF